MASEDLSRFSFGVSSAIITGLALIVGLDALSNPKAGIIGTLLVFALADNVTDSLSIYVYRESQPASHGDSKIHAVGNFISRLAVTLVFVSMVFFLSLDVAVQAAVVFGLVLLTVLYYGVASARTRNPLPVVVRRLAVAGVILLCSHFLVKAINSAFGG